MHMQSFFPLFILLFVWSCSCCRCGSRMVLVILLWQLLFTVLNYAYHYLSTLANMLLQMDRNCMILSSRWRSSSPLNKYVYLNKRRKQTGIVLTTASLKNIAISSEQTVSRKLVGTHMNSVWLHTRSNVGEVMTSSPYFKALAERTGK